MQVRWSVTFLLFVGLLIRGLDAAELTVLEKPDLSLTITLQHGPPVGQTPEEAAAASAPAETVFLQGDPIDVAFTITNQGEYQFRYMDRNYARGGRMREYALELADEQGQRLEDPRVRWGGGWFGGGKGLYCVLQPGQSFTKHIYLNQWVMPLAPGRYTVVGVYHPPGDFTMFEEQVAVRSQPVEIEVRSRREVAMKGYIERLALELRSDEPKHRLQAIRYLGFTGSAYALPSITPGFYDKGDNVAFWTGKAFLYMTDRDACVNALLTPLNERGPAPGLHELLYHYQIPKEQTLAPTIKGLSDPDPVRRAGAATALWGYSDMGDPPLDALLSALKDEDPQVQESAAAALSNYRVPKATEALLAASYDPDEEVRRKMVDVLGTIKAEAAIPRLRELLEDTPRVATTAVRGLQKIGTPEALEALHDALEVEEEKVRVRAALALLSLGDDTVRTLLAEALESALPGPASDICSFLNSAVEQRGIPGPAQIWSRRSYQPEIWIEWLRQEPSQPAVP